MTIHIQELRFETIIGLLDFERTTPQEIIVTCNIEYSYHEGSFINYAELVTTIKETLLEGKFELLESALEKVSTTLHVNYPLIETLYLKIVKPHILPDATVGLSETYHFK